ncbi:hypothetical protein [Acetobacter oryzoeni]|uniref:Uncharacterized protein n=1 Tax=Acetobacter oryzoeni TaxID=2500548 RepID=A0A5B9GEJ8_9PROT|nr:hypothetical protein [Acetobacter oryzoeni]MCP1202743.1 hypothetical protein [Acetobacter oryzoeni]QEE84521.1 hypothetical protein EOV40_001730 [Acetobacter oryzoeni]
MIRSLLSDLLLFNLLPPRIGGGLESTDLIYYWHQNGGGWTEYNYQNADDFLGDEDTSGWIYKGPVLTPTQINEMLAAERERICLIIERSLNASCGLLPAAGKTLLKAAAEDITDAIRNLGAAP